jgi:hypothetical protein
MDEQQEAQALVDVELEAALQATVALIEARVVENLTRIIERLVQERNTRGGAGGGGV